MTTAPQQRVRHFLIPILILACLLRLYPILSRPIPARGGLGPMGDSIGYHYLAYHLLTGQGYSSTEDPKAFGWKESHGELLPAVTRGPTYPLFLAATYKLSALPNTPEGWTPVWQRVRIIQALLDSSICLLVFLTARRLANGNSSPGLWAAGLYCLNPYTMYYTRILISEPFSIFCLAVAFLAIQQLIDSVRPGISATLAGLSLALASMARPENLPLAGLLTVGAFFCLPKGKGLRYSGLMLAALLAGLAPWAIRTSLLIGKPTLTPVGQVGYVLFKGSFETPDNWRGWDVYPDSLDLTPHEMEHLNELTKNWLTAFHTGQPKAMDFDQTFRLLAEDRYRTHFTQAIGTWFSRIPLLWHQRLLPIYAEPEPGGGPMLVLLVFAGLGTYHFLSMRTLLISVHPALITLLFLPLHVESRFSVLTVPGLCTLAGLGLHAAAKKRRSE